MMSCNSCQVINGADKHHIYCLVSVQETLVSVLVHLVIFLLYLEGFCLEKNRLKHHCELLRKSHSEIRLSWQQSNILTFARTKQ